RDWRSDVCSSDLAGDDGVPGLGERATEPHRLLVGGVPGPCACGAEHADGVRELGECAEPVDELALDPQYPPRVGVQPVRVLVPVQETLVRGGPVPAVVATDEDGAAEVDGIVRGHGRRTPSVWAG